MVNLTVTPLDMGKSRKFNGPAGALQRTVPATCGLGTRQITPRRFWSNSIDSNSAWKFPSPNPSFPLR